MPMVFPLNLNFFYSYLKRRKQCVKINNACSTFQTLISGVPQGSVLGPILFNIFINGLFFLFDKSSLTSFADDNTISTSEGNIERLIKSLERKSNIAINWFTIHKMIVNPDKFQAFIIQ